ncbi:hypothetical protein B0H17DRAFT_1047816 [Mycena rosella]|uniref:NAD(P)-binding protein n=1 Tax=Mycena rosella TaxID=1033263 RepID=A0AAD7GPU7_MYCRO|nr:hypothetical protein B0H17DRAFT_1047816 [Mycena rosella]
MSPAFAPIKTCVLGVGLAGLTFHIPFILALPECFTLISVLERNPTVDGGKLRERFGVTAKIHNTLEQVLGDSEIELVIIGTPNPTHYPYAKAALEAGKHVLVDKPVASTTAEAKELGEIARAKGLVLYAFQNRRFDSDFLSLKKLLSLPESSPQSIGDVVEFETHFDRYRRGIKNTWKDEPSPGAGHTYDLGTHLMDQVLALFGRPDKLTAFIQNSRGVGHPDVDDSFTIFMHYNAGPNLPRPVTAIARAQLLSVRSPQPRYAVLGTKGSYVKYGVDVQEDQLKVILTPTAIHEPGYGVEPESIWGTVECLEADDVTMTKSIWPSEVGSYANLFRNLAAAIREGAELAVKWEESTMVLEMVELAHKSSKAGATLIVPK